MSKESLLSGSNPPSGRFSTFKEIKDNYKEYSMYFETVRLFYEDLYKYNAEVERTKKFKKGMESKALLELK